MYLDQVVHVVNRTLDPKDVTFDGRPYVLRPGYCFDRDKSGELKLDENGKPAVVPANKNGEPSKDGVPYAEPMLTQVAKKAIQLHPLMGSQDPMMAHPDDFLVGIVEEPEKWPISFLWEGEATELIDRSRLPGHRQSIVHVAQRGRRVVKKKQRDPKTKRVIGADSRSRERFTNEPMDGFNQNSLVGATRS